VSETQPRAARRAPAPASPARAAALQALAQVLGEGRSSSRVLDAFTASLEPRERALARELCLGVLRFAPRLERLLERLLTRPLRRRDADVRALLLLGLYQLLYTRIPDHAAVSETVALAEPGKPWAGGLVNAVLRRFQREREGLLAELARDPEGRWAHPAWLVAELEAAWPHDWTHILEANNARAPMTLRVNARRSTREAYLQRLERLGLGAHAAPHTEHGVVLHEPREAGALPGFAEGLVSVQDGAGQLAAALLDAPPGSHVLDACAAPGGKAAHLLERAPGPARVVCLDRDAERLGRLRQSLRRLGLDADAIATDATRPGDWWDGGAFDRILLDVPCTATGVIRRHPDIRLHRRPADVESLAAQQQRLLDAVWPLLARSGRLLYATCSVLPRENERQVEGFLGRHEDARVRRISAAWGRPLRCGRQILPGEDGMDGFYYALLEKR